MNDWERNLTPFDAELCLMLKSLTGKEVEPKFGGDHYFLMVNYEGKDSDYISAIMDAVKGRIGERLIELKDYPDDKCFLVRVKFDETKYPELIQAQEMTEGNYKLGCPVIYMGDNKETTYYALPVDKTTQSQLIDFVGNGEIEIGKEMVFHFISNGTWRHAKAGEYIVYNTLTKVYSIVSETNYINNYV